MLLLHDPRQPDAFVSRPCRLGDRLRARLFATALDRELAAGCPPEVSGPHATRAQALVEPSARTALAGHWGHLLDITAGPRRCRMRRVPLCGDRIAAASAEIDALRTALVAPVPVPAGAVARARQLITDGSGPLYNRRSSLDLATAVREVTVTLETGVPLGVLS